MTSGLGPMIPGKNIQFQEEEFRGNQDLKIKKMMYYQYTGGNQLYTETTRYLDGAGSHVDLEGGGQWAICENTTFDDTSVPRNNTSASFVKS
jgi:hypothetical protein